MTVNGLGFQVSKGSSYITFNNIMATTTSWSDSQIVATVPGAATTGTVKVVVNGLGSTQQVVFTMPNPVIATVSPTSGPVGTQVLINGSGFGATQSGGTVTFNNLTATIVSWSDSQIQATVPSGTSPKKCASEELD